jgi:hypothetical protein
VGSHRELKKEWNDWDARFFSNISQLPLNYILPNAMDEELGRWWPRGNRKAQILTLSIILLILVLTVWGAIAN